MYSTFLHKVYKPSFLTFVAVQVGSFFFPKLSPFIGIVYHSQELSNNINYTNSLHKIVALKLPGSQEVTERELIPQVNDFALIGNTFGFLISTMELYWLISSPDRYLESSIVFGMHFFAEDPLKLILSSAGLIFAIFSFLEVDKQYKVIDENFCHIELDPLTEVVGIYDIATTNLSS
jgi:hypothetical protein